MWPGMTFINMQTGEVEKYHGVRPATNAGIEKQWRKLANDVVAKADAQEKQCDPTFDREQSKKKRTLRS